MPAPARSLVEELAEDRTGSYVAGWFRALPLQNGALELNGALSNPLATDKNALIRLRELRAEPFVSDARSSSEPAVPRVGETLDTVKKVLLEAGKPLAVRAIHASCERVLGRPVVYSTVKDCLSDRRRRKPLFRRVRHGWYETID